MGEYNYNGQLAIINFVIWLILIARYFSEYKKFSGRRTSYKFLCILCIITFTFAFAEADTYHYQNLYAELIRSHEPIHVENFYFWLSHFLPQGYFLWRFVIWGTALWLMIKTFNRYELDKRTICFVFPLILIIQFSVTRGCLGIALMLFSLSYLLKPGKSRFWSYVFGISGIILSSFLHRSLPLFVILLLLSFIPLRKGMYILSVLLFPVLRIAIMTVINYILLGGMLSEGTSEFADGYFNAEAVTSNLFGYMRLTIEYIPRLLTFIVLIKTFCFSKEEPPRHIRVLLQYSYILFYLALLFFGQELSSFVSSRTIHMMCFPLTIVLAYYLMNRKRPVLIKVALSFYIFVDIFTYTYTIYKWF